MSRFRHYASLSALAADSYIRVRVSVLCWGLYGESPDLSDFRPTDPTAQHSHARMPFNEKLAFVENVLDIPLESRFGPSRVSRLVVNLSDKPELEPAVFFNETGEGLISCYALSPLGRNGYQVVEAQFRKEVRMGTVRPPPYLQHESPHRLRGSPDV